MNGEPTQVIAGDTWTWTRPGQGTDYPASAGWVLTYYLSIGPEAVQKIQSTPAGDDFAITVDAASTGGWAAGAYRWTARVSRSGEVHTVGTGDLQVLPDPTVPADRRTWEAKMVAALEPAILASAGSLLVEYEIDGVKGKLNRAEAVDLLNKCRAKVQSALRRQQGKALFLRFPVRF